MFKGSMFIQTACAALVAAATCLPAQAAIHIHGGRPLYAAGQVLVKYKRSGDAARVLAKIGVTSAQEQRHIAGDSRLSLIQLSPDADVMASVRALRASGLVQFAEPNYYRYPLATTITCDAATVANHTEDSGQPCTTPNDPEASTAWYFNNAGSTAGNALAGADLNLPAAWGVVNTTDDVTVAVIDDGFDLSNPDLAFLNSGTSCVGSNACSGTAAAKTDGTEDHGTWVSGTLAATGDNGVGTAGATWHTTLIPVKSDLTVASIANAIHYAVDHGAKIINESFGGPIPSNTEYDALNYALSKGVLVVVAAGNNDSDNDRAGAAYPANYSADSVLFPNEDSSENPIPGATTTKPGLPNVIAVAASDSNDNVTSWSQWGSFNVAAIAPGSGILATQRGGSGTTQTVDGTSFSTPLTSGIAALTAEHLYSANTATLFSYEDIKAHLLAGTDSGVDGTKLEGRSATGRLNAFKALQAVANGVMVVRGVAVDDATALSANNNGNGEIDQNELANLDVTVADVGPTESSVSGTLTYLGTATSASNTTYAQIVTATVTNAALTAPTGTTLVDPEATLSFPVQFGAIPDNESLLFELDLTPISGGAVQKRYFYLEAGSLANGNALVTRIGRNDFDDFQGFHIAIPSGASNLIITSRTDNGTDIDLLVQKDGLPQYLETLGPNPDANPEFTQYIDPNTQVSGNQDGNETVAYDGLANPYNYKGTANPITAAGTYNIVVVNFTGQHGISYSINACYAPAGSDQITLAGNVEVAEDAKTATLTLLRSGSSGAVSVHYATSDGGSAPLVSTDPADPSAIAGTNYTSSSGTVSWADGDSKAKTISVPVINSGTITKSSSTFKHFTVTLSGLSGGTASTSLGCLKTADVALMQATQSSGGTTTPPPSSSSSSGKSGGGGAFGLFAVGILLISRLGLARRK